MKILLLCLHAFETMEMSPFIDILGWARDDFGCDIEVVTCGYQRKVESTFGVKIEVDTLIADINTEAQMLDNLVKKLNITEQDARKYMGMYL